MGNVGSKDTKDTRIERDEREMIGDDRHVEREDEDGEEDDEMLVSVPIVAARTRSTHRFKTGQKSLYIGRQ